MPCSLVVCVKRNGKTYRSLFKIIRVTLFDHISWLSWYLSLLSKSRSLTLSSPRAGGEISPGVNDTKGKSLLLSVRLLLLEHIWFSLLLLVSTILLLLWPGKSKHGSNVESCSNVYKVKSIEGIRWFGTLYERRPFWTGLIFCLKIYPFESRSSILFTIKIKSK